MWTGAVEEAPPKPHGHSALGTRTAPAPTDEPLVAIRSWDAITPFGDATDTWAALLAGRSIDDHARAALDGAERRAFRLARAAAAGCVAKGVTLEPGAAVIVGTSKGPIEEWLAPPPGPDCASTSDNLAGGLRPAGLGDIAAGFADILGLYGPRLTVSAACASGLHALIRGAMMVRSGQVRQALVVAAEASLHPLFLGSFQRLGVLAKPGAGCRPFDVNRDGFLMGEAAAAVLLEAAGTCERDESYESGQPYTPCGEAGLPASDFGELSRAAGSGSAAPRPPHPRPVFVERFALGGDATHLTGGDPDAATLRRLLAHVIDGRPIDLVHAHGTGTPTNDPIELAAIESAVVPSDPPPHLYSHKGALGHSLGAAGLLAVVINCLAHAHGVVPPNARTTAPLATTRVRLSPVEVRCPVRRSLVAAAGFGGPTAVVSLVS